MSDEMNIQKVIEILNAVQYNISYKPINEALDYLESLQSQPTGRTVEEIREYCEKHHYQTAGSASDYDKGIARFSYSVMTFIDSASVEPVEVDDVCVWADTDNDCFIKVSCAKDNDDYDVTDHENYKYCPNCGRKILRKGE